MKKIWLMGGFGNVLFQILAYNVIKNEGHKDVFYVTKLTEKNYITKAIKWSVHERLYDNLISDKEKLKVTGFYAFFAVLLGFLSKATTISSMFSSFYTHKKKLDTTKLPANIFGYFQEKDFLSANQSELHILGNLIKEKYALSKTYDIVVHYRKGDSGWAVLHKGYYESIRELLKKENQNIHIVTDSYKNAEEFFTGVNNVKIINSENAIDDFKIMLSARKLYCAPSTFSWWAAHTLDENSEVIAPQFLEDDLGMYVKGKCKLI